MLPGSLVFFSFFFVGSFFFVSARVLLFFFFLSCWTDIGVCGGGNSKGEKTNNKYIYYKNRILVKQTTRARLLSMIIRSHSVEMKIKKDDIQFLVL